MKVSLSKITFAVSFLLAMALTFSCSDSSSNGSTAESLDGTYQMQTYTLEISKDNYTLKISGENYGKGKITYDDSNFEIVSTHAWEGGIWFSFEETVTGNYTLNSDGSMTMSWGITGKYNHMNGLWAKTK